MTDDVDQETRLPNARPCPFCGSTNIWTYPGSTFRWRYAGCGDCGVQCGEVRIQTIDMPRPEAISRANDELIAEWNRRVVPPEVEQKLIDECAAIEGLLAAFIERVEKAAFAIRPPNPQTPVLVQYCQYAQSELDKIRAERIPQGSSS